MPNNGGYKLSVISPNGEGCGNGLGIIKDANGNTVMQFSQAANVFTNSYSVEFTCNNADVEETSLTGFNVFPNPADNQITIEGQNICEVLIYNALGQIVWSKTGDIETVDTSSFDEGLYVVNVKDINGNSASQRIVIVR